MYLIGNFISFIAFFFASVECSKLLRDESQCGLVKLCGNKPSPTELDILECVQRHKAFDFTKECRALIGEHAKIFFRDEGLRRTLNQNCPDDIKTLQCKPDQKYISCVLESKDKQTDYYCQSIIQRIEYLLTSSFKYASNYLQLCERDILKLKCNVALANEYSLTIFEDGGILDCLQKKIDVIEDTACKQEILFISEIQGEDVKLDKVLQESCSEDRIKFCRHLENPDSESVYKCLQEFVYDPVMTVQCQKQLLKREKLVVKDTEVSKGLVRACRADIKLYKCKRSTSDHRKVRLAQMLLCLENAAHNGSKIGADCKSEMLRHRKFLMEDYRLSPEVVGKCSGDIENFCNGLESGGKTIHCLLEHSRPKRRKQTVVSTPCQRELENLLKVTDAGEDWRVDPVLRKACESVVRNLCPDAVGENGKVISCLMDNINSVGMEPSCESALMQIQYFVARDFKLDPQLFKACKSDAVKVCHAKNTWNDDPSRMDPERGPLVLPCLYRYAYSIDSSIKLKPECEQQVKRVMKQRAMSVELIPEVEEMCMDDLVAYCTQKTGAGEEMLCLQDKFTSLKPKCKMVVGNFTEAEAADINLNPVVKTHCRKIIDIYCKDELRNVKGDSHDTMGCLIKHKNDEQTKLDYKCRATIEHFQLISINDYHFTKAFKEACRPYVIRYCPKAHTKPQVVECLSEVTQNDTLKDEKYKLSKECRSQLRGQLQQQREFIDLDPKLKSACEKDIKTLCTKVEPKSGQVLECLVEQKSSLSILCHKMVFKLEQHDFTDSSSDYTLLTTCKQMIKEYCKGGDTSQAFTCLKKFKDEPVFDNNCKSMVLKRMLEQSTDYRLNPALRKGCTQDIGKFCQASLKNHLQVEFEGKVLKCLKIKFREGKLRKECEKQLSIVLKESALNYKLNPLLRNLCTAEIYNICGEEVTMEENGSSGKVEECLKLAFTDGRIVNRACRLEVAGLIEEAKADIHVDPILHQACALDIAKYCIDVPPGAGRVLQCLQTVLASNKVALLPDCKLKLTQRMEMFKNAEPLINSEPKDFQELIGHVSRSPSKKYFVASLFSIIGIIFMLGLFCGRVTRRAVMLKNK